MLRISPYPGILGLMLALLSSGTGAADMTSVTLEGELIDSSCTFAGGLLVKLPDVQRTEFTQKGTVLAITPVNIELKDCAAGAGKVDVYARGSPTTEDEFAFANTSTRGDSASGVGLYFYQEDGSTLFRPDGSVGQSVTTLKPSVDNTLTFSAGYVALTDSTVAGSFSSVVNILLDYK